MGDGISRVTVDDDVSDGAGERIVLFRPRRNVPIRSGWPTTPRDLGDASPVADLAEFERPRERDDYRHRMIVNAVALAFTVALAGTGVWIAESMALIRKNQDCVLMGRKSCSPIPVPTNDRWSTNITAQQR